MISFFKMKISILLTIAIFGTNSVSAVVGDLPTETSNTEAQTEEVEQNELGDVDGNLDEDKADLEVGNFDIGEQKSTDEIIEKKESIITEKNDIHSNETKDLEVEKGIMKTKKNINEPILSYTGHVQSIGWQQSVRSGEIIGTEGLSKRLEAFVIDKPNIHDLSVEYTSKVEGLGWMTWSKNGEVSGTEGQARKIEAVKARLTGEKSNEYDIYYQSHSQSYGWLDWAKNGEPAGTSGENKQVEAIKIQIVKKGSKAPGPVATPFIEVKLPPSITYTTHVQSYGWLDWVQNGTMSGTQQEAKRIEAIKMDLETQENIGIEYSSLVRDQGWQSWKVNGELSGTVNESLPLEAIMIKLTGSDSANYDIYYRLHVEKFGWLGWAKNGEKAGSEGYDRRAEAIEIKILPKNNSSLDTAAPFKKFIEPSIVYSTHVQTFGWMGEVKDGQQAGTTGQTKRLEAIKIALENQPYNGSIEYKTHVEKEGWMDSVAMGAISGTSGEAKRVEGIEINLTGEIATYYDVYYRAHIESFGWLGWAKNGMKAGSEALAKRMEAIEIKLVKKGLGESVDPKEAYQKPKVIYLDPGHGDEDPGAIGGGVFEKDLNLQISLKIEKLLKNKGYIVKMSRRDDTFLTLAERSQDANKSGADIFISIHQNAFNGTVRGLETFYYNKRGNTNNLLAKDPERIYESSKLAYAVHNSILDNANAIDRKIRTANFHVVRETQMTAILLELGYIDNIFDRSHLVTESYQNKLAAGVVNGIENYFNQK